MNELPDEKNENKKPILSQGMVVVAVNVGIFIICTIYARLQGADSGSGIVLGLFIILQIIVNIVAGIASLISNSKAYASGFFLSAVIVLLIGVSTCFTVF